jgi:hypothetical protein
MSIVLLSLASAHAALAGKLIEIAGKCRVHRTLEAGAGRGDEVAG